MARKQLPKDLRDGLAVGAEGLDIVGEVRAARAVEDLLAREDGVVDFVVADVLLAG